MNNNLEQEEYENKIDEVNQTNKTNQINKTDKTDNTGKNGSFINGVLVGIMLAMIVSLVVLYISRDRAANEKAEENQYITNSTISKFDAIINLIDSKYYNKDDDYKSKIQDYIYKGLLASLDDNYAYYFSKEEWQEEKMSSAGNYCGIGVTITLDQDTNGIHITSVYDNSPAKKAGIQVDDVIIGIDGEDILSMDFNESNLLVKGEEGSKVLLTIKRKDQTIDIEVERGIIELQSVSYKVLDDNIGYIYIKEFDTNTVEQFKKAVEELQAKKVKGLIFDVRSNKGGLYTSVVKMLDMVLPEGIIVYSEYSDGKREEQKSDADCIDLPMCVLVNKTSASASEIFAGAIKDYKLGPLIGKKTYGKGIVQNTYGLTDGSAVKFTVAKYYTPSGKCIHGEGIEPDIDVDMPSDPEAYNDDYTLKEGMDAQLNRAIEYINNGK